MIIACDVDDVVADLIPAWLLANNQKYGDQTTPEMVTRWRVADFSSAGEAVYALLTPELYDTVELVPGAQEGIQNLRQMGHRVVFVTSTPLGSGGAKLLWLRRKGIITGSGPYGDGRHSEDYVEVYDKSLIHADIIIDDKPENVQNFKGEGILFNRPHNHSFLWPMRADTWEDVVFYVLSIAEEHRQLDLIQQEEILRSFSTPEDLDKGGVKYDQGKAPWDLLPWDATEQVVAVLAHGAKKYAPYNWSKGIKYSRLYSATMRHIKAFWGGQDMDPDSGIWHLAHALCCLLFLLSFQLWNRGDLDDRPEFPIGE